MLKDEAETTMNVLLPLLTHKFPGVEILSNFSKDVEDRCQNMHYDTELQMVIDDSVEHDSNDIEMNEGLYGFDFTEEAIAEMERPPDRTTMPDDSDSISTLRTQSGSVLATKAQPLPTLQQQEGSSLNETASTFSGTTTLTTESYQRLDTRILGLASQIVVNQQQQKQNFEHQQVQLQSMMNNIEKLISTGIGEGSVRNPNSDREK